MTYVKSRKQSFSKAMILITVILMDILGGAEVDLFVPSFPELQSRFELSAFWVEALLSINFIGFCLSLLFVGGLADRYGRKPIILLGLVIFIVGSMLCLWAMSYPFLLVGRFFQGVGVAAPATLCFLIIADSYPLKQQQFLMAMLNGIVNTSVAVAPVVGSYVTMYFHWQGNFMVLLLLGLVVLVMTLVFIPNYKLPEHKQTLSLRAYIPILHSKFLMLLIVIFVFMCVPYWIFVGMSPLLYIEDLGVSLAQFGYYQGALALIFAVGSVVVGLFIKKYDQAKMLYIAGLICIVGLISIALVAFLDSKDPLLITFSMLPYVVGTIIPCMIIYPLCLHLMPQSKGRIAALIQASRLIFAAIGLELAGYYYAGSFRNIGIIVMSSFLIGVIALFIVIRNDEFMEIDEK